MGRSPRPPRPRGRTRRRLAACVVAVVGALALPALVAAHPLGNFTINHYAGIRISPASIELDVVIDRAEIPAFQARATIDADGDGTLSTEEIETGRIASCIDLSAQLDVRVDGTRPVLAATTGRLAFPPGAGGLTTMRLECGYRATLVRPPPAGSTVTFEDGSDLERLGWREVVLTGTGGVTLGGGGLRAASVSERLTSYPADRLASPLDDRSVMATVTAVAAATDAAAATRTDAPVTADAGGTVPGGVIAGELPEIFRAPDLTPVVLLLSLLSAAALGAGHALTPGHGKTLMAAYLVGTRGTPWHAMGLGLSVTVSHTIGILALAAVIVGAQGLLAPDTVIRGAPVVAAISIVAIGAWMLTGEVRRRRAAAAHRQAHVHAHTQDEVHPHAGGQQHEPNHGHAHEPGHEQEHSHGGIRHSHVPTAGSTITWRGLFVLGLAGGLIPSTSALLILLGAIAAGRPTFGFVLIVAFGLGMAGVMSGIGLALVLARGRLDGVDPGSWLGRASTVVPLAAAALILGLGCWLTIQAIGGAPTL